MTVGSQTRFATKVFRSGCVSGHTWQAVYPPARPAPTIAGLHELPTVSTDPWYVTRVFTRELSARRYPSDDGQAPWSTGSWLLFRHPLSLTTWGSRTDISAYNCRGRHPPSRSA